jgi:hypothetical protein
LVYPHSTTRAIRAGVLFLVLASSGLAGQPVLADPAAEREATMAVTVVPRSDSGVFRDTALVYLDGRIDAGAPDRLAAALDGINGQIAIWLNSPGGNLFAGMQTGRVIRKHGASTHIIDSRTLLPGECYSACSLAFLGGVYRFNDNGARYGVHRTSLRGGPKAGDPDLDQDLSAAIRAYVREMGVDARLLDLWVKARPDEMYVLSEREARNLGVVNNGRKPPEWSIAKSPGGSRLQGRQVTADGTGTVSFSCDKKQTVFGSVYEAGDKGERFDTHGWRHWLTIDRSQEIPLSSIVGSTFVLPPDVVRRVRSATQIGHQMKPPDNRSTSISYAVDIDDKSAATVKSFLGNCLREQAK